MRDERLPSRLLIWTVAAAYLSMAAILLLSDLSLDLGSTAFVWWTVAAIVPFVAYARWRRMKVLPAAFDCLAAVILSVLPILVWTYAAMNLDMPMADARLEAMDAALGFDWHAFIGFVDQRPWLANALARAYSSFYLQLLLLPPLLALFRRERRAYAMVIAYYAICFVSSVVSIWFPALGTYVVYGVTQTDLSHINAMFGFHFLDQFNAIRAPGAFTLSLDTCAGILTFPSVHAAVAALCAWAAWEVRLIRYPVLVLNVGMAASAVSHANHYLIDVIAGIGITAATVTVVGYVFGLGIGGAKRPLLTQAAPSPA